MKLKWIISLCLFLAVTASAKTRKTVFVIIDGVPADMIERLNTPAIDERLVVIHRLLLFRQLVIPTC